jgi:hypothetical protein
MPRKSAAKSKRKKPDNPANEPHSPEPSSLTVVARTTRREHARGTGSAAAGQSGDLQGLPRDAVGDSESVEELIEEGQAHEAELVSGVENAPGPEQGEVHTHEPSDKRGRSRG